MDNIEEMKQMWIELNERLTCLEKENKKMAQTVKMNSYKSNREKLVAKYKKFIFLESLFMIFIISLLLRNPMANEKILLPAIIYVVCFALFEIFVDFYLMIRLKRMDIYTSTVKEISNYSTRCWKIHKIAIFIGLPIALGGVILIGIALNANSFMIAGMICGGIVGLLIGLKQLREFISCYRELRLDKNMYFCEESECVIER